MIAYQPTTHPMTGEEQQALVSIFEDSHWYTPSHRLRLANDILDAGFRRTLPRKVTRTQLWSYGIETLLLALCAQTVSSVPGLGFVFGVLVALTLGSALTFVGGLIINHAIKTGFRK